MQILKIVQTGEDSSGGRIVLQIVQNPVHLVKLALRIPMPNPQLIAIGLPNGAGFIGPAVPAVALQNFSSESNRSTFISNDHSDGAKYVGAAN